MSIKPTHQTDEWGRYVLPSGKVWTGQGTDCTYDPMGDEIKKLRKLVASYTTHIGLADRISKLEHKGSLTLSEHQELSDLLAQYDTSLEEITL